MGWTVTNFQVYDVDRFLIDELRLNREKFKVLAYKSVKTSPKKGEFYAAVEYADECRRVVFALVVLFEHTKEGIAYKDMDENMGPYYYNCPAEVLEQLTPTDNENANEWRAKCLDRLLKKGVRVNPKVLDAIKQEEPTLC